MMCVSSDACLSVAYIGPKSRTERPRKTKIGTEVGHVRRDSDTTFKVKGKFVADVLHGQHAGTGATWQINASNILLLFNVAVLYRHSDVADLDNRSNLKYVTDRFVVWAACVAPSRDRGV